MAKVRRVRTRKVETVGVSAVRVLDVNPHRVRAFIQNKDTADRVAADTHRGVSLTGEGFLLDPAGGYVDAQVDNNGLSLYGDDLYNEWWVVAGAAGTPVYVYEVEEIERT